MQELGDNREVAQFSINSKGEIKQTIGNCVTAISIDEKLASMFRYNLFLNQIEIFGAWWRKIHSKLEDNDINNIRLYLEQQYDLTSEKGIPRAIEIVAHQNAYHPIRDYLNSLKWDGIKRIENIFPKYLGAEKSEYTAEATKLFMLAVISRVFYPGIKFDTMLCVVGTEQGTGKSTMGRFLSIRDEWFTDDLKRLDDENVYRKLQGHLIIEMPEMLATANAKTVEEIKAFITRQKDTYKVPYEKYSQDIPRQCVFYGTTNNLNFLPDDKSGNRRFIPIMARVTEPESHPLDNEAETRQYIIDAYAEAMEIFRSKNYSLTFPENMQKELRELQQEFSPEDPKIGIIQEWLDNCKYDFVCSIMIYRECFNNEYSEPKYWELKEINNIMNYSIAGWKKHPTSDGKVRFKVYGKQRAWDKVSPDEFIDMGTQGVQIEIPFD